MLQQVMGDVPHQFHFEQQSFSSHAPWFGPHCHPFPTVMQGNGDDGGALALTLAIRKEKSIILEMCTSACAVWGGWGRVMRRSGAARDGSGSVPGERREGAQRAAVPAAVHVVESQRRRAVAWRCSARVSAAMAGGGGLEG